MFDFLNLASFVVSVMFLECFFCFVFLCFFFCYYPIRDHRIPSVMTHSGHSGHRVTSCQICPDWLVTSFSSFPQRIGDTQEHIRVSGRTGERGEAMFLIIQDLEKEIRYIICG